MPRLIDADALGVGRCSKDILPDAYCAGWNGLIELIEKAPTIDAVPVVRCRECKHRSTEDCPMYFHSSYWHEGYEEYVDDDTDHTEDDYFCQEGERKEGADNDT